MAFCFSGIHFKDDFLIESAYRRKKIIIWGALTHREVSAPIRWRLRQFLTILTKIIHLSASHLADATWRKTSSKDVVRVTKKNGWKLRGIIQCWRTSHKFISQSLLFASLFTFSCLKFYVQEFSLETSLWSYTNTMIKDSQQLDRDCNKCSVVVSIMFAVWFYVQFNCMGLSGGGSHLMDLIKKHRGGLHWNHTRKFCWPLSRDKKQLDWYLLIPECNVIDA